MEVNDVHDGGKENLKDVKKLEILDCVKEVIGELSENETEEFSEFIDALNEDGEEDVDDPANVSTVFWTSTNPEFSSSGGSDAESFFGFNGEEEIKKGESTEVVLEACDKNSLDDVSSDAKDLAGTAGDELVPGSCETIQGPHQRRSPQVESKCDDESTLDERRKEEEKDDERDDGCCGSSGCSPLGPKMNTEARRQKQKNKILSRSASAVYRKAMKKAKFLLSHILVSESEENFLYFFSDEIALLNHSLIVIKELKQRSIELIQKKNELKKEQGEILRKLIRRLKESSNDDAAATAEEVGEGGSDSNLSLLMDTKTLFDESSDEHFLGFGNKCSENENNNTVATAPKPPPSLSTLTKGPSPPDDAGETVSSDLNSVVKVTNADANLKFVFNPTSTTLVFLGSLVNAKATTTPEKDENAVKSRLVSLSSPESGGGGRSGDGGSESSDSLKRRRTLRQRGTTKNYKVIVDNKISKLKKTAKKRARKRVLPRKIKLGRPRKNKVKKAVKENIHGEKLKNNNNNHLLLVKKPSVVASGQTVLNIKNDTVAAARAPSTTLPLNGAVVPPSSELHNEPPPPPGCEVDASTKKTATNFGEAAATLKVKKEALKRKRSLEYSDGGKRPSSGGSADLPRPVVKKTRSSIPKGHSLSRAAGGRLVNNNLNGSAHVIQGTIARPEGGSITNSVNSNLEEADIISPSKLNLSNTVKKTSISSGDRSAPLLSSRTGGGQSSHHEFASTTVVPMTVDGGGAAQNNASSHSSPRRDTVLSNGAKGGGGDSGALSSFDFYIRKGRAKEKSDAPSCLYYPVHPFISYDYPVHFIPVDNDCIPESIPLYSKLGGRDGNVQAYPSFVQVHPPNEVSRFAKKSDIVPRNLPIQNKPAGEVLPNILPTFKSDFKKHAANNKEKGKKRALKMTLSNDSDKWKSNGKLLTNSEDHSRFSHSLNSSSSSSRKNASRDADNNKKKNKDQSIPVKTLRTPKPKASLKKSLPPPASKGAEPPLPQSKSISCTAFSQINLGQKMSLNSSSVIRPAAASNGDTCADKASKVLTCPHCSFVTAKLGVQKRHLLTHASCSSSKELEEEKKKKKPPPTIGGASPPPSPQVEAVINGGGGVAPSTSTTAPDFAPKSVSKATRILAKKSTSKTGKKITTTNGHLEQR